MTSATKPWLFVAFALVATMIAAGCNIITPAYLAIHGPEKVPAVHTLDPERTTIVFIDDPGSEIPQRRLRSVIGSRTQQELLKRELIIDMIDTRTAIAVASKERHGEPMSLLDIGRAAGADVVVYAWVRDFEISPDGITVAPKASANIKVFDVENERRIWPEEDSEGYAVNVSLMQKPSIGGTSKAAMNKIHDELAQELGLGIAQLFYQTRRPDSVRQ